MKKEERKVKENEERRKKEKEGEEKRRKKGKREKEGKKMNERREKIKEEEGLERMMEDLQAQTGVTLDIIVADGGSTDGTRGCSAKVIASPPGRGAQMNAGAAIATAEHLLFLHADSRLESTALLRDALTALRQQDEHVAGHFPLRFARARSGHDFFFRYLEGKTRSHLPTTPNGDKGLLNSKKKVRQMAGIDATRADRANQRVHGSRVQTGRRRRRRGLRWRRGIQRSLRPGRGGGHPRRQGVDQLHPAAVADRL